jgi:hypothetical protein
LREARQGRARGKAGQMLEARQGRFARQERTVARRKSGHMSEGNPVWHSLPLSLLSVHPVIHFQFFPLR